MRLLRSKQSPSPYSGPSCPVSIISGFLGAGKTTLLASLLASFPAKEGLVVIENDYADLSFDASLLRQGEVIIKELSQGCICCSLAGSFSKALLELGERYQPKHLFIEPSGVGRLSDIRQAFRNPRLQGRYELRPAITLIHAPSYQKYLRNFADFFEDQIRGAQKLILNRSSQLPPAEVAAILSSLTELNPLAQISVSEVGELRADQLQTLLHEEASPTTSRPARPCSDTTRTQPAATSFARFSLELGPEVEPLRLREQFAAWEELFPGQILRAKGFVQVGGQSYSLQYQSSELELSPYLGELPVSTPVKRSLLGHIAFITAGLSAAKLLSAQVASRAAIFLREVQDEAESI